LNGKDILVVLAPWFRWYVMRSVKASFSTMRRRVI